MQNEKEKNKTGKTMIWKYIIAGVLGAVIGGAIGYFGKCSGST
jgi:membrane protein DedA with SNARE-associated domain